MEKVDKTVDLLPRKRQLPKLIACLTKTSLENMRNKAVFAMDALDPKEIRRRKLPLYQCVILELRESGFTETSSYLQDLVYDNMQLLAEDEIGIVVDVTKREDYLNRIANGLKQAEKAKDKNNPRVEAQELLKLGMFFAEQEKGIYWLAERLFLASVAVSSKYLLDGGRLKAICKFRLGKFLLDKFPGADTQESLELLTDVRDISIGKDWYLYEPDELDISIGQENITIFKATAIEIHGLLLKQSKACRAEDITKSERLARLAERRAKDAQDPNRMALAIIEIGCCQLAMNNLNNAQKTFEKALTIFTAAKDVEGQCITNMHLAAVMQKLRYNDEAGDLLTEMGSLAMDFGLRRQLGRALYLLGELHLRSDRPDLGTYHLAEAFSCFMGYSGGRQPAGLPSIMEVNEFSSEIDELYKHQAVEVYYEEAEQSRLMMAVSAGQDYMNQYYDLIRSAKDCHVAQLQVIDWKLAKIGWWIERKYHEFVPCPCPEHHRTPLDVFIELLQYHDKVNVDLTSWAPIGDPSCSNMGNRDRKRSGNHLNTLVSHLVEGFHAVPAKQAEGEKAEKPVIPIIDSEQDDI